MTIDKKTYDYQDVKVFIDDKYVSYEQEVTDPDLSFTLGTLRSELPLVLYYEDDGGGSSRMEAVCRKYGIITAGAPCSQIPLSIPCDDYGYKLFERFDPLRADSLSEMRKLVEGNDKLVVGCSVSSRHALALANELRLATAILVGPTQAATTKRLETIGLSVPRVSLIETISRGSDVPVIGTASAPEDVVKALVAGADAALVHFGGPYDASDDLDNVVKAVTDALRDNLVELCCSAGAKKVSDLAIRCYLTPKV